MCAHLFSIEVVPSPKRGISSTATLLDRADIFHQPERDDGGLRFRPFQYPSKSRENPSPRSYPVARFNLDIQKLVNLNNNASALRMCIKMRDAGVRPTRTTYNLILEACANEGMVLQARATLEDMIAAGLQPDGDAFYQVLRVRWISLCVAPVANSYS